MALIKIQKKEKPRWKRNRTEKDNNNEVGNNFFSRLIFYFLTICFFGVSVYVLLFSSYMQIDRIEVSGNKEIEKEKISDAAKEYLGGKYLGIFPKNNYLLISQGGMEKNITDYFKKIRTVSVVKKFPDSLKIDVEERKSLLVWCSAEKCYLVDDKGFAYIEADFTSREIQENQLLKIVQDDGKQVDLGSQVMSDDMVKYYTTFREVFLQKTNLKIAEEFHLNSRLAEDGVVKTQQGFDLLVNFSISPERSAEIMKTFLDKQYKGGDLANLAYVDLRVENKIFYKMK